MVFLLACLNSILCKIKQIVGYCCFLVYLSTKHFPELVLEMKHEHPNTTISATHQSHCNHHPTKVGSIPHPSPQPQAPRGFNWFITHMMMLSRRDQRKPPKMVQKFVKPGKGNWFEVFMVKRWVQGDDLACTLDGTYMAKLSHKIKLPY